MARSLKCSTLATPAGEQMRVLNGVYLTNWKLGRTAEAETAFGRVVAFGIAAGARTINVPDTVGYAVPELYGEFIRSLRERIPNSGKAVWSVHCHNDLGLAVANTLAAVRNGVRQAEVTINGIGERAGNTSLEELVMAQSRKIDQLLDALAEDQDPDEMPATYMDGSPVK